MAQKKDAGSRTARLATRPPSQKYRICPINGKKTAARKASYPSATFAVISLFIELIQILQNISLEIANPTFSLKLLLWTFQPIRF